MKKIYSTLAIAGFLFASCSKDASTSNPASESLLKKYTLKLEATASDPADSGYATFTYDDQKRLSGAVAFDGDDITTTSVLHYDGNGTNPTSVTSNGTDGSSSTVYYYYNGDGKLSKDSSTDETLVRSYVYGNNITVVTSSYINDPDSDGIDSLTYDGNNNLVREVTYNQPNLSGDYQAKIETLYKSFSDKINPLYKYFQFTGQFMGQHLPGSLSYTVTDFTGSIPPSSYNVAFTYGYDSQGRVNSWIYTVAGIKLLTFTFEYY
jgi:hypothetical protein